MRASLWFTWLLYVATHVVALSLAVLVVAAPLLAPIEISDNWDRILDLFAGDVVVRRVSLAAAIGLAVTAQIFFAPKRSASSETADA